MFEIKFSYCIQFFLIYNNFRAKKNSRCFNRQAQPGI